MSAEERAPGASTVLVSRASQQRRDRGAMTVDPRPDPQHRDLGTAARRGTAGAAEVTRVQQGEAKCSWCGQDLQERRGGSPQRFCSTEHRLLFWSTLRRWGARAVAAGILTIADIRNGDPAACTLPGAPISPPSQPAAADGRGTLSDDFGRLLDEMDEMLGKPTIPLLIRLGWLARNRQKDHAAVVHGLCRFVGHVLAMTRNARP